MAKSFCNKVNYLVAGKILDDNRPVTESMKYQKAQLFKKKIMTEKEFELFCRHKMKKPDFLLGRTRKKDTTENAYDYYAGGDAGAEKEEVDDIDDIS